MIERMRSSRAVPLLVVLLVGALLLGGCGRDKTTAPSGFTQLASLPVGDGVRMTTYQGTGSVAAALMAFVMAAERDGWKTSAEEFIVTDAMLALGAHERGAQMSIRVLVKGRDVQLLTATKAGDATMVVRLTGPQDKMGAFYGKPGEQAVARPDDPSKPKDPVEDLFPDNWLQFGSVPDLLDTFAVFAYSVAGFSMRYEHEGMETLDGQKVNRIKVMMDRDELQLWVRADGRTVKAVMMGADYPGDPNDIGTMMLRDGFLSWLQDNTSEVTSWEVGAGDIKQRSVEQQSFGGKTYDVHRLSFTLPHLTGVVEVHYVNLGDLCLVTRRAVGEDAFQVTEFVLR